MCTVLGERLSALLLERNAILETLVVTVENVQLVTLVLALVCSSFDTIIGSQIFMVYV